MFLCRFFFGSSPPNVGGSLAVQQLIHQHGARDAGWVTGRMLCIVCGVARSRRSVGCGELLCSLGLQTWRGTPSSTLRRSSWPRSFRMHGLHPPRYGRSSVLPYAGKSGRIGTRRSSTTAELTQSAQVIQKTWHRIGTHIRLEWKKLLSNIRSGTSSITDARDRLAFLFGKVGVVWEIENVRILVPPCPPPRPP